MCSSSASTATEVKRGEVGSIHTERFVRRPSHRRVGRVEINTALENPVGGPLDGRVHTREPDDPPPPVVRHTHLHDGPKIVHLYDLHEVAGHGGEYRLREA